MGHQWCTCKFWCSLANAKQAARCWAVSTGPSRGCWALTPPSWSLFWSETCTQVAHWRSFCRTLAVLLLFLLTEWSGQSCCWVVALSSSRVMDRLLASPPCPWDCAWDGKPSCDSTYGCAILEELDYLCNLNGLQVPPHATSSDKGWSKTREKTARKDKER